MSTSGVRGHFQRELARLVENVLRLGSMARQAVARALQSLNEGDVDLARQVIADDLKINDLRYEIERQCYALIATEQPVARDLRTIVAALTVSSDLERIADHGKKLASICQRLALNPTRIPMTTVGQLAELALDQFDAALAAYSESSAAKAEAMCDADTQVDVNYKQTFNVLLSYMLEDPRQIGGATQLLQAAHELERIGDRATNIGERVIFTETGELGDRNA